MPVKKIYKRISSSTLTPEIIGNIILDIEDYQNFIPYCNSSKILMQSESFIKAEIAICFSIFKAVYTSDINFISEENKFQINLTDDRAVSDNPFKHLANQWIIKRISPTELEINFFVDFTLKNFLLNKIATASLDIVANIILNAFIKKVKNIC